MNNIVLIASVAVILVLLFLKVPVFVSLLAGTVIYFSFTPGVSMRIFAQRFISGVELPPLLAVPFFVCAGVLMNSSGVTRRIMNFCEVVTARMYGGLAQVNILLSTLMGGLSGSAMADAAMEAKLLVPDMVRTGFPLAFSSVITATSAIITPLIPPGIAMILYGSIANLSIGKLFVAGIGPGLLLCLTMMVYTSYISKKKNYGPVPRKERLKSNEVTRALKPAIFPLFLPIVLIGGIRLGIFTPTEAGSVAIVYALILGLCYKEIDVKQFLKDLKDTAITTASIMVIVGAASAFAWILTREKIPQQLTQFIVQTINNKILFMVVINVFLIFVGMFIEGNAALIVLVPLLAPMASAYGIHEIQFAMVVIFNLMLGAITPPMGTLMFITCGVTKCKIKDFIKASVPFYLLMLTCLVLLSIFPIFTVGLVNLIW